MMTRNKSDDHAWQTSVSLLMRVANDRLARPIREVLYEHQLTLSQWTMLVALNENGGSGPSELARIMTHDAGSLTRLVDKMICRKLVKRHAHGSDRRLVTVELTARGRSLVSALTPQVVGVWNDLLSGFARSDVDTLIGLLTRLSAAAANAPPFRGRSRSKHAF